jgi:hypothetical protein
MKLRKQQSLFAKLVCQHVLWLYSQGYEVTLAWAYRPPWVCDMLALEKKGIRFSLHRLKLALDINLFKNGKYLTTTEAHRVSGERWKKRHPLCRWGGDIRGKKGRDGNHYSMERGGVK